MIVYFWTSFFSWIFATSFVEAYNQDLPPRKQQRHSRRDFVSIVVAASLPIQTNAAPEPGAMPIQAYGANGEKKPRAPLENLLPATRVLLYLTALVELIKSFSDPPTKAEIDRLQKALEPRIFVKPGLEEKLARKYLDQPTYDEWIKARKQDKFLQDSSAESPLQVLDTELQDFGRKISFQQLRKRQMSLEKTDTIRAAFNAYTNNLVFGENYRLNLEKEEKSQLIRQDRLPDITSVVRSDLDMRDLYRNQVLDFIEDARAEFDYQRKRNVFETQELLELLEKASNSCIEWFKFVPEKDIQEAIDTLKNQETLSL